MTRHNGARGMEHVLQKAVNDLINVHLAHDAVHPDRDECGGIGGCALMKCEHHQEQEVIEEIVETGRAGYLVSVTVHAPQATKEST